MTSLGATVGVLQLLGEPTRVRLLALLAEQELTVAELTSITELAQSRVSTHLAKLREAGILRDKKAGASTLYALNAAAMPAEASKLWALVAAEIDDAVLQTDRERCAAVLLARRSAGRWPDSVAGQMERHYSPGRTWESTARGLVGLVELGDVLDAGAGDGAIAQLLAPRARSYTCLDRSRPMIDAARVRLRDVATVGFHLGDIQALPFAAARFDHVLLLNVLASVAKPAAALAEAARVLRPGGRVAVVTLASHRHLKVTRAFAHNHAGFQPAALARLLSSAGLKSEQCEITSRERRPPHFQVVTAFASKPAK